MSDDKKSGNPDSELIKSVWAEARSLMARLEGSSVQRLSVAAGGTSIEIERDPGAAGSSGAQGPPADISAGRRGSGMIPTVGAGSRGASSEDAVPTGRQPITAPLVGTFYRAASPDAPAFVELGDIVEPGQPVGIVEAMKLMNEVQATAGGTIVDIVVQNGQAVEFEQLLMYIEPVDE